MIPKGELKSTDFTIFYLGRKQLITVQFQSSISKNYDSEL